MLSGDDDLSPTDEPQLRWAEFSMTSIGAPGKIHDDNDDWSMSMELELIT